MNQNMLNNTIEEKGDVYKRNTCRLCGSCNLLLVMPFPATPIADGYVPVERAGDPQACYALDLYLCEDCGLVHLRDVVNPELIYRQYLYETTTSPGLVSHFQKYAEDILTRIIGLFQIKDVVEVQYNDLFSPEKRPNIDFLNVFSGEKVNKISYWLWNQMKSQ